MASNSLPTNSSQLVGLGTKMLAGLTSLGSSLGITQITPPQFQDELNAFITANSDFNAARSARQTASDAFQTAESTLTDWLQLTRNVLAGRFGNRWSTMWAQAGFINPSTGVPRRIEERLGLALNLANFFTANPSYEVASMNITATKATALRAAAIAAKQTLTNATLTLADKATAQGVGREVLTSGMRSLIKILDATLGADDSRWLAFGLQVPSSISTPGQPENVTASTDATGAIIVQCDPVALATRYRVRMLLVGVETDYRLVARSTEPMAAISDVLPGQTVQIIVQAVNGNLQGVASDPIQFTVLLPDSKKAATISAATPELSEPSPMGASPVPGASTGTGRNGHAASLGARV